MKREDKFGEERVSTCELVTFVFDSLEFEIAPDDSIVLDDMSNGVVLSASAVTVDSSTGVTVEPSLVVNSLFTVVSNKEDNVLVNPSCLVVLIIS